MRGGSAWATEAAARIAPSHAMRTAREYLPAPSARKLISTSRAADRCDPVSRPVAQRGERADEVARRFPRISVLVDQHLERRLGASARLGRQARLVARQELDQVADPLG